MKNYIFILMSCCVFLFSCSDYSENQNTENFESISQSADTNPPPPLQCKGDEIPCAGKCVNTRSDNRNCGWCEEVCNIAIGDFCDDFRCKNVRDFGFEIHPRGPRSYNPRRDLPRPPPVFLIPDNINEKP